MASGELSISPVPFVPWGSGPVPTEDSSTGGGLRALSPWGGAAGQEGPGKSSEAGRQAALSRQELFWLCSQPFIVGAPSSCSPDSPGIPAAIRFRETFTSLQDALGVSHLLFPWAPPSRPGARLSSKAQLPDVSAAPHPLPPELKALGSPWS